MRFLKSVAWAATLVSLLDAVHGAELGDKVIVLPLTHQVAPQLNKRQGTDTERLFNDNAISYNIEVGIGTPPQLFNVTLDTGSPYLWVPSASCPDTQCPVKRFDGAASSTFNQTNVPFSVKYGIGNANGTYALETVTVGGFTVAKQAFGVVSSTQDFLKPSSSSNGIMGLSFPVDGDLPFVFNLVQQSLITQPIFSVFLNARSVSGYSGEIMFGGIDSSKYQGDISYFQVPQYAIPVTPTQAVATYIYWTIAGSGITTTTGYSVQFSSLQRLLLDTGSTMSYGPSSVVSAIVNSLTNNQALFDIPTGWYAVSCSLKQSTDYVVFNIEESFMTTTLKPTKVGIPVSELILHEDTTGQYCAFGLAPMVDTLGGGSFDWILGQTFLRSVYAVHDMRNARVGLASVPGLGVVTLGEVTKASVTPSAPGSPGPTSSSEVNGEGKATSLNPLGATQSIFAVIISILFLAL